MKDIYINLLQENELPELFKDFSDLLSSLEGCDFSQISRIQLLTNSWFMCYEEDFIDAENSMIEEIKLKGKGKETEVCEMEELEEEGKTTPVVGIQVQQLPEKLQVFIDQAMKNKVSLNQLIRDNKNLLKESLKPAVMVIPQLFDFDNKFYYFRQEMKRLKQEGSYETIQVTVNRNRLMRIFEDSYDQMRHLTREEMLGKMSITFVGERGQDAGGLTREWFVEISKTMFNP